jgi:cytochrome bd-type quinol oxidase subunit 2
MVGAVVLLPVILGYTGYVYWLFRGKVRPGGHKETSPCPGNKP